MTRVAWSLWLIVLKHFCIVQWQRTRQSLRKEPGQWGKGIQLMRVEGDTSYSQSWPYVTYSRGRSMRPLLANLKVWFHCPQSLLPLESLCLPAKRQQGHWKQCPWLAQIALKELGERGFSCPFKALWTNHRCSVLFAGTLLNDPAALM